MSEDAKEILRLSHQVTQPAESTEYVYKRDPKIFRKIFEVNKSIQNSNRDFHQNVHDEFESIREMSNYDWENMTLFKSITRIFESIAETLNSTIPLRPSLSMGLGFPSPSTLVEPLVHQTSKLFGKACGLSLERLLQNIDELHMDSNAHSKHLAMIGAWAVESSDGEAFLSRVRALVQRLK